jgi:hypothetical protein
MELTCAVLNHNMSEEANQLVPDNGQPQHAEAPSR